MTVVRPAFKVEYLPKQKLALKALSVDSPAVEVLYGGAASGGKSFLIQDWQIKRRINYPGTRGFIGRNDLGDLRKFTMPEMLEKLNAYGLVKDRDYHYNGQDMFIRFWNGSVIFFVDMYAYPSDPDFQRYGSTAYTDGAIEEAAEIVEKSKDIMLSRLRYKLTEFCSNCSTHGLDKGIVTAVDENMKPVEWKCKSCKQLNRGLGPKLLMGCNPHPGYLRSSFYDPYTDGTLDPKKAFIPALASDNKHTPAEYIELLMRLPEMDRKRLLDGDWYYDNSSDTMFQYLDLIAAFNDRMAAQEDHFYITCDVARLGKDKTVIVIWHGLVVIEIVELSQVRTPVVKDEIRRLMNKYGLLLRHVIADEDGIGGGVVDEVGCLGFVNNAAATDPKRYPNIKHECYFKLAELIEKNEITFAVPAYRERIIKELQAIRRKAPDGDTKLMINSKDEQKRILGHSPDYADAIMFRMNFLLRKNYGVYQIY